jgi:regulator of sigma E protease
MILSIWSKVWPYLAAVLFFGLVIMIHEVGHFSFAKLFKVKVNEFALGMGPTLFKFKKGETKYAVRLLPIGGFVNMEGETADEDAQEPSAESGGSGAAKGKSGVFYGKPRWQRAIILAAGACLNIILGMVLIAVMLGIQQYAGHENLVGTRKIHSFYEDASSTQYGLMPGDEIVRINGKYVFSESDIGYLITRDVDGVIDFTVKRSGQKTEVPGVAFRHLEEDGARATLYFDFVLVGESPGFINVLTTTPREALSTVRLVWLSLFDLITGQYGLTDLSGPVGIVTIVADAAQEAKLDLRPLLRIAILITINVGIFNLLPIPGLDGGRLLFLAVEGIRRKPIRPKYEGYVHAAGLALLFLFMIVVTFSDIIKLIRG